MFSKTKKTINQMIEEKLSQIPTSGGNYFNLALNTISNEEKMNSLIALNNPTNDSNWFYSLWEFINMQADYFCNVFKWESDKEKITILETIRYGFIFSTAGIYKLNNTYIPITIVNIERDLNNKIIKIKFIYNSLIRNNEYISLEHLKQSSQIVELTGDNIKNVAIYNYSSFNFPSIVKLKPLYNLFNDFNWLFKSQALNYKNNVKFNYDKSQPLKDAIQIINDFKDPKKAVLISQTDGIGTKKNFEKIELEKSGVEAVEFFNQLKNLHYELIGRKTNLNKKTERNVSSEIDLDADIFDIVNYDKKIHLQDFFTQLKHIGINAYIVEEKKEEQDNGRTLNTG